MVKRIVQSAVALATVAAGAPCAPDAKVPCFPLATGNQIPQIAMGTWGGSYGDCKTGTWGCIQQHARFAVETFLRIGGTHIDGANDYKTQVQIAEALRNQPVAREDVFITTKCPGAIGYNAIIQCADDNLQMLGQFTDAGAGYIDLLLIHFPFVLKPQCRFYGPGGMPEGCSGSEAYDHPGKEVLQDTWRAMEELKRIGVVKSIGVSDYNITNLQWTLEAATMPIELNQVEWNPRDHDEDMLAFCKAHGIQLQAWSPLGGSHGSVLGDAPLKQAAAAHQVSTAQVALRWSLQRGVAVVVGTANPDHAASDMDIFSFNLTDAEMQAINNLNQPSKSVTMV